ncbi:hypothetical protein [Flavobacterium sp. UBA6046]|uniref:hypothetical protein n=1 Tax=Flavobacterium sp. UBA6046 TaxID=1946552 RepID=UPI0025C03580|nr:hypothetical protein [Flavobacterium sp. UBA6046]
MKVFKYGFIIAAIALVVFMYNNPPRTATIKLENGANTTASVPVIVGKVTLNSPYPVFRDPLGGGYVIGTGGELAKVQYVQITNIKSDW